MKSKIQFVQKRDYNERKVALKDFLSLDIMHCFIEFDFRNLIRVFFQRNAFKKF